MAVALVDRGIGGEAVEVAAAFDVIHPYAIGALDHHIQRMVVISAVKIFEFHKILSAASLIDHGHKIPFGDYFLPQTSFATYRSLAVALSALHRGRDTLGTAGRGAGATHFLPKAWSGAPCARTGRFWPGGNRAPWGRHRLTY